MTRCSRAFADQTRPFDEIIVVDNGSTDDSADVAERARRARPAAGQQPGIRRRRESRDRGRADADWIAILNNDVTLAPDWLETLLAAADEGRRLVRDRKNLCARAIPPSIDGTFDEISRGACACRCGSGKPDAPRLEPAAPDPLRAHDRGAVPTRRCSTKSGCWTKTFESYLEDVDFGLRCALAGRTGVYVPAASRITAAVRPWARGIRTQSG